MPFPRRHNANVFMPVLENRVTPVLAVVCLIFAVGWTSIVGAAEAKPVATDAAANAAAIEQAATEQSVSVWGGVTGLSEQERAAEATIREADLRRDAFTLAADSLEGREAGTRGGWAAASYILTRLRDKGLTPAGEDGSFLSEFGAGYRNILALLPGRDERVGSEVVVVCGHYDHVGYGTRRNSRGPIGQIHNGADDNASGSAGVLEVAEALAALKQPPRRTVLFVWWDAEEKGLLGSRHFVKNPAVPLDRIRLVLNADMIGRLRNNTLQAFGWRTGAGLRQLLTQANRGINLKLSFPSAVIPDSDHFPFYERGIPYLMLHTGKHEEYHRPSDDAPLLNVAGMKSASRLLLRLTLAAANSDEPIPFRATAAAEGKSGRAAVSAGSAAAAAPPPRLGVSWNAARGAQGEIVLSSVDADSPAARAGLQPQDRILAFAGTEPKDSAHFVALVRSAVSPAAVRVQRAGQTEPLELTVQLAGTPSRLGIEWYRDSAEPQAVIISAVFDGSPAAAAGLKPGDRILQFAGSPVAPHNDWIAAVARTHGSQALLAERAGRILPLRITLPKGIVPE